MLHRNQSNFPLDLFQAAIVDEAICPGQRGRVKYKGSYWWAYCCQEIHIMPNTPVSVVNLDSNSLTLIVELRQPTYTPSLTYI